MVYIYSRVKPSHTCTPFRYPAPRGRGPSQPPSVTPNLALRNRPDPAQPQIDRNRNDANDPEHLRVVLAQIPEDNCKYDTPQVAARPGTPAHDAVGVRMHVRHEAENRAIAGFQEECHAGNEPEHGGMGFGVSGADGDKEGTSDNSQHVDEVFLAPDVRAPVYEVREHPTRRAADDVEKAEHGSPAPGSRLLEGRKVLDVVGAEDGVDSKLGAKGAEVGAAGNQGLEGENHGHGFLEAGLDHDFTARSVEDLLLTDLGLVIVCRAVLARGFEFNLPGASCAAWTTRAGGGGPRVCNRARDIDDGAGNTVGGEVLLNMEMTLRPFAGWGVRASE